ncbi:cryptochrome circadian regulator 4 isoform X2 [Denticeps clupeoides]|uniref:Photolyase/cryptochrome alpha/beta domain-containing protein n=1 Tax=Denticeps clupeoides TaxID=299321 RepID=A0AAY4C318_9TELE|nr:cryptochrome-1-like isoform X2 [Denticeps clupeoides]
MTHRTIHLFNKGLRLHDNPSLLAAMESSAAVYPVYVLDRQLMAASAHIGPLRWRFILQSLEDLHSSLQERGSRLHVLQGPYLDVVRHLVARWGITQISFDSEVEPHCVQLEAGLRGLAGELGLSIISCVAHTLYDVKRIIKTNDGKPPLTYKKFLHVLSFLGEPDKPARDITTADFQKCLTPRQDGDDEKDRVPTFEELGLEVEPEVLWPGGESHALKRLEQHFQSQGWVANFSKPRTIPNSLLPSTTGLSPYLSLGCLSVRTFYHRLSSIYAQSKNHSLPPVSLQGQVLWREFFYTVASATPNFTKMEGNPICLQIGWYDNQEALQKWKRGQTGFPWIDAIMTQLRQEGWIHHLARHAVACFLTRGDLWISWEEGMKVFEEYLLDADYSINAGNWMWLSASAFFHHYTRIFCPVRFGRRTDPEGQYLRKYLPVLKNFPSKYIYEPWNAPEEVQLQAGCVIGKDYPLPMVSHQEVSERNLELMKQVRSEQGNTAELTRDVADDPMEIGAKRHAQEEGPGADESAGRSCSSAASSRKRCSSGGEHGGRACSWTPEAVRLPEISSEVM